MHFLVLLLSLLSASAQVDTDCCNTWIRNEQTSKAQLISFSNTNGPTLTTLLLATGPTTIDAYQIDLTIGLEKSQFTPTTFTPSTNCGAHGDACCTKCLYQYTVALWVNLGTSVSYLAPPSFPNPKPLSNPANYYFTWWAQASLLNSFIQRDTFEWSSLSDSLWNQYFPGGVQLNAGDSIVLTLNSTHSGDCENVEGLVVVGITNYVYAYAQGVHPNVHMYLDVEKKDGRE